MLCQTHIQIQNSEVVRYNVLQFRLITLTVTTFFVDKVKVQHSLESQFYDTIEIPSDA